MDENEGMGGSYVADPKTGKRKLVERTQAQEVSAVVSSEPVAAKVDPAPAEPAKDQGHE